MDTLDEKSLERFRAALRIKTLWPEEAEIGSPEAAEAEDALRSFQSFLAEAYPAFHRAAERTVLSPYSVVYRWPAAPGAREPADQAAPVLFLAHYDVVPVDRDKWTIDPFAAEVSDGFVYARGALDTKNTLICALEAAEALAERGFAPRRDLYFAFGGDEERSGSCGAAAAAARFREQGLRFDWALDEGSIVSEGQISGVQVPLALIGVEEKGFLDIELVVTQAPGHASRPPKVQAVAVLAEALGKIARKPFPFHLTPTVEAFFANLAPLVSPLRGAVLSRARALGPLFPLLAAGTPETAALLRTTVAMTQLFGSRADNVLPSEARAVLNLRLLSPWTVDGAVDYVRRIVADDRVTVRVSPVRAANGPVGASEETARGRGPGWAELCAALGRSFPEAAALPFLVTATTDSRHYADLCRSVYRFGPLKLGPGELARIHGHDERISMENLSRGIDFYAALIERL